jgi:hypothetical protein
MKKIAFFAMACVATFVTGCVSYHTERDTQSIVNPSADQGPTYRTNWKIEQKRTSATGSARVWFGLFVSGDAKYANVPGWNMGFLPSDRAVSKAKAAATYAACEQTNADALLGVAYKYKMTDYIIFSTVDCEVEGYPAKVTGLTLQDTKPVLIDDGKKVIRMKTYETLEDYTSKK